MGEKPVLETQRSLQTSLSATAATASTAATAATVTGAVVSAMALPLRSNGGIPEVTRFFKSLSSHTMPYTAL